MIKKFLVFLILCLNSILFSEVYDCFPFWKEVELLKIRLEELYDVVDHFVIVEATQTFTGLPKPLYFAENAHLFEKYKEKIIHIVVDDFPNVPKTEKGYWTREIYQHNAAIRGLQNCQPSDIILLSDLDEIPRRSTIQKIKDFFSTKPAKISSSSSKKRAPKLKELKPYIVSLELQNFSCQLNRIAPTKWSGPAKAVPRWVLNHLSVNDIHLLHQTHPDLSMIKEAGWHMNTMGDWKTAIEKWLCHNADLANSPTLDEEALKRNYLNFQKAHNPIPIDDTFPRLVRENVEYYRSIGLIAEY